jgi:PTS system cellobiose-specific IIB component
MRTIALVCNTGLSTNLLKEKMEKNIQAKEDNYKVLALASSGLQEAIAEDDSIQLILLAPQMAFLEKDYKKKYEPNISVQVVDMEDYFNIDGESIMEIVRKELSDKHE